MSKQKKIYLDYASTTPIDSRVLKAMGPYLKGDFGNPSSLHSYGQKAMTALDKSRETIAGLIGAKFNEIIFTGSATEANNLALRGVMPKLPTTNYKLKTRIIVSAIEHESVLETAKDLETAGVEVVYLPVNKSGFVDLVKLKKSIDENTVLVSIMYANNEIGVIQNISEIAKIIRNYKETRNSELKATSYQLKAPLLHTDAVQAFQYLGCNVDDIHIDMMTLSSHKIYGPKGAGCLYVRNLDSLPAKSYQLKASLTGGGQEFGYRSGTENIPAIVGFAKAAEITDGARLAEAKRTAALRDYMWAKVKHKLRGASLNGDPANRLPNNLNFHLPKTDAAAFLIRLDLAGIAASSGSACTSRALMPSHVIKELGYSDARAGNSIRMTLGRFTTKSDIDKVLRQILK